MSRSRFPVLPYISDNTFFELAVGFVPLVTLEACEDPDWRCIGLLFGQLVDDCVQLAEDDVRVNGLEGHLVDDFYAIGLKREGKLC